MARARISELARQHLAELRKSGIEPTDEQIVQIYLLGRAAQFGQDDARQVMFQGETVGNVTIYPLTLGAKVWLATQAAEWFENNPLLMDLAVFYAAANSKDAAAFAFRTARDAKWKLIYWGIRVNAKESQIKETMERVSGEIIGTEKDAFYHLVDVVEQIRKQPGNLNLGPVQTYIRRTETWTDSGPICETIGILMRYYGQTQEYWLWKVSDTVAASMIRQAARMEKDDDKGPNPDDPAQQAYFALKRYVAEIKDKHHG